MPQQKRAAEHVDIDQRNDGDNRLTASKMKVGSANRNRRVTVMAWLATAA